MRFLVPTEVSWAGILKVVAPDIQKYRKASKNLILSTPTIINTNTYFVADVHLAEHRPQVTAGFVRFCEIMAEQKATLYILGDLFDAWLGDDLQGSMEKQVLEAIMNITVNGGETFFIAGNRDFLVGEGFFAASGCQELPDTETIRIADKRVLLLHGDSLCILDEVHQNERKVIRTAEWKKNILEKSPQERMQLKQEYFTRSSAHIQGTKQDLLEIPSYHIEEMLAENDLDIMIYGHIHEPKSAKVTVQDKTRQVICLGDWGNQNSAWFGQVTAESVELYHISLALLCEEKVKILDEAVKFG